MQKLTRKIKILIIIILILGTSLTLVILNNNKQSKLLKDKVKPNKTNIAIYVCDEEGANCTNSSTTPSTGSYSLDAERSYCTNGGTITYNGSTKKITYSLLGEDECYVYLNEYVPTASDIIAALAGTTGTDGSGNEYGIVEDHGIRYVGKNPSNWVWFNCSSLTEQNASTCERWRIIGVFNEKYDTGTDGKPDTEGNLVKIIRNDSLGNYSWDYKQSGVGSSTNSFINNSYDDTDGGSNDWSDSQLMMMLNPPEFINSGFVNENDTSPVHDNTISGEYVVSNGINIFRNMGSYFDSNKTAYPPANTTTSGYNASSINLVRMNILSQPMIATAKWYLTGTDDYLEDTDGLARHFYNYERNIGGAGAVYTGTGTRPKIWYGKIGLMYPSDYGFATSGNSSVSGYDRASCLNYPLIYWVDNNYTTNCAGNSWIGYHNVTASSLGIIDSNQWTITPSPRNDTLAFLIYGGGGSDIDSVMYGDYYVVRPVLYLEPSVSISGGTGTYSDPYSLQ